MDNQYYTSLNTKCKEDQFANTLKSNGNERPSYNSTNKILAKVVVELNQPAESSGIVRDVKQLGEKRGFVKKKWKSKVIHGGYIRSVGRQTAYW